MSTVRQVRISQLRASLRECNRVMEEFPPGSMELLQQLERDEAYGASMTDATFTTACARCAAPLEITDATADAVSKAHEERCFVVGDWVRGEWDRGWPVTLEGVVLCVRDVNRDGLLPIDVNVTKSNTFIVGPRGLLLQRGDFRRIPRPEQAVKPLSVRLAEREFIVHRDVKPENVPGPLDVLYDCETLRSLLVLDEANRRGEGEVRPDGRLWMLSQVQRAVVSAHWSAELRERIAVSKERERLTVVAPDLELELANCKDAE